MPERFRCTQCKKIFKDNSGFVDHKLKDLYLKMNNNNFLEDFGLDPDIGFFPRPNSALSKFEKPWHYVWSKYGNNQCGPIEVEKISDYHDQMEHFLKEKI